MIAFFKSKTYLRRILISIASLAVVIVSISSAAVHVNSERMVLRIQREADQKILAQINYNIHTLNELVNTLATSLFWDPEITELMYGNAEEPIFEVLKKLGRLDTVVHTNSFLDSILVYNSHTGQLHSGGERTFRNADNPRAEWMMQLLQQGEYRRLQLLPVQFNLPSPQVDLFSYIMNDAVIPPHVNESALVLNVKPDWLFHNITLINGMAQKSGSQNYLVNSQGDILSSNNQRADNWDKFDYRLAGQLQEPEENGYFDLAVDREKYHVSYSKTIIEDLYLVTIQPSSAVLGEIYQLRSTSIWLISAILLFSLLLAVWIARRLYRPVQNLTQLVKDPGHSYGEAVQAPKDELSLISSSYKHMRDHLMDIQLEQRDKQKIYRNYSVRKLISDSAGFTKEEISEFADQIHIPLSEEGCYALVLFKIDDYNKLLAKLSEQDIKLYKFAILNIAKELFSKVHNCEAAEMRSNHLVILLHNMNGPQAYDSIPQLIGEIQEVILRFYKITPSAAVSGIFHSYRDISHHYEQLQQYALYQFVFGKMSVITPEMIEANLNNTVCQFPPELEKKLCDALKSGQLQQYESAVELFIRHISTLHHDFHLYSISHMVVLLRYTIYEMNSTRVAPVSVDLTAFNQKILELGFLDEIGELFKQLFHEVMDSQKQEKEERNDILMETVKDYIQANYMDSNLNLQGVAAILRMSADYVGRIFKKYEAMSVADYMNEVRLNHARQLLENNSYTINEIMEKVGYANQSSFFKNFKKKFGATPREYRIKKSMR
ncbi:MAG: hypothetical protein K0R57_4038 [Paenibacillaceae bacterium]|jgi:AraC-like DNA-binding protein|nr:hypothetical protein [Paenibacillaceae bacterium]